ncbi:DUF7537 family lipoprotein [Haloglomus litoreum]|uniref:DUF7537 family lipoprotein n=1 Tax=Haloglomus litoreum TaxID=3034026 RepID=UPI0023E853D2|nr:hypothetical protein [Haloglomus sp. DT116]
MTGDENPLSRRTLLASGAALGVFLAGCSGTSDEPTPTTTPTPTPDGGNGPGGGTPTGTPTPTPAALESFDYPAGATRSGIDAARLLGTHEATVTDAGSVTVMVEEETTYENRTETLDRLDAFDSDSVYRRDVRDQVAERAWSPADESVTYVRMDVGDRRRYRIDDSGPGRSSIAGLEPFDALLAGAAWGEARAVVETLDGGTGVVYDATGVADEARLLELLSGQVVTDLTASVTVGAAGYVEEATYDLTVRRDGAVVARTATVTVTSLGETTVPEPSWANTARREGTRFDAGITSSEDFVRLELVNGADLPAQTTVLVTADRAGSAAVGETVTVGETVYAGFNEAGKLQVDVGSRPLTDVKLRGPVSVVVELGRFTLFRGRFDL